jgi:hypothetical protein
MQEVEGVRAPTRKPLWKWLRLAPTVLLAAAVGTTLRWGVIPTVLRGEGPELDGIVSVLTLARRSSLGIVLALAFATSLVVASLITLLDRGFESRARGIVAAVPPNRFGLWILWATVALGLAVGTLGPGLASPLTDSFHEGEWLGFLPAFSLPDPFRRVFLVHGFALNVMPAMIAKKVGYPGSGIVCARAVRKLLDLLAWGLGIAHLIVVDRSIAGRSSTSVGAAFWALLLLLLSPAVVQTDARFAFCFLQSLLMLGLVVRADRQPWATCLAALIGLSLPLGFLFNYLLALVMLPAAVTSLAIAGNQGRGSLRKCALSMAFGVALGVGLLGAAIGWTAVNETAEQVTYWVRFGARIWSKPAYGWWNVTLFWLLAVSLGFPTAFLLLGLRAGERILKKEGVLLYLLVFSGLVTLSQVRRSEEFHLPWACFAVGILLFGFLCRLAVVRGREPPPNRILCGGLGLALFISMTSGKLNLDQLFVRVSALSKEMATADADLLDREDAEALRFLRSHLNSDDCFFTLTSEGTWYYFLDVPSCSRFHQLTQARTWQAQREVVSNLEATKPPLILYANEGWWNRIDGIPARKAHPMVFSYVDQHYEPYRKIGEHEIWRRRPG